MTVRMTPDSATASDRRYAAFRHGAFLRFWVARFLATFSTQIVSVAVGWQVYDLTRDPFDIPRFQGRVFDPTDQYRAAPSAGEDREIRDVQRSRDDVRFRAEEARRRTPDR